ncbi:MAG TPA: hypothetical protein DCS93_18645 [Microscillaceae bacterium]|nr:hypothetical protein [Microscillaceae bacterium]
MHNTHTNIHQQLLLSGISSLLVGSLIYVCFRTNTLKLFDWIALVGLDHFVEHLRYYTMPYKKHIPGWVLFSLPDGLWMFSYGCAICYLWKHKPSKQPYFWILLVTLLILLVEVLQLFQITSGVFDPLDVLFYILGAGAPLVLWTQAGNTLWCGNR